MSAHVVETTSELSAFMKAGVMAGSERDAGFCSGADEDDMSGLHSPSASEDSVEVQVTPISLRNKRKLAEPRRIQEQSNAPLKKRRYEQIEESAVTDEETRTARSPSPFRPWSMSSKASDTKTSPPAAPASTTSSSTILSSACSEQSDDARRKKEDEPTLMRQDCRVQEDFPARLCETNQTRPESPVQPRHQNSLSHRRDARQKSESASPDSGLMSARASSPPMPTIIPVPMPIPVMELGHPRLQEEPLSLVLRGEIPRVPSHPGVSGGYERPMPYPMERLPSSHHHHHHHHLEGHQANSPSGHSRQQQPTAVSQQQQQRNYKNMTRERRIEANARERTRVHTISAAFDTLRRAIPAYSHNQKLSKLSVLRIACSYIMTLGKIVNTPEGEPTTSASLGACVDLVSRTIQTEGKLRKRKDD